MIKSKYMVLIVFLLDCSFFSNDVERYATPQYSACFLEIKDNFAFFRFEIDSFISLHEPGGMGTSTHSSGPVVIRQYDLTLFKYKVIANSNKMCINVFDTTLQYGEYKVYLSGSTYLGTICTIKNANDAIVLKIDGRLTSDTVGMYMFNP